jgi:hypothetical protein
MIRLYLFAEGQTEQTFASTILNPHFADFEIYITPILIAHAKKGGVVHRGGGRNYLAMKNDICRFLQQEKEKNVFFTTMIDLYSLPEKFPGFQDAQKVKHIPYQYVQCIEQAFAKDINDPRFIPYVQLFEFETYLFSDPSHFSFFYNNSEKQISQLIAILNKKGNPELIDDGPQTAPSKRIIEQFPDYKKAKPVIGVQVADHIGINLIREKCQHFNEWITTVEHLSR